jgi:hypothetical protein
MACISLIYAITHARDVRNLVLGTGAWFRKNQMYTLRRHCVVRTSTSSYVLNSNNPLCNLLYIRSS